MVPEIRKKGLSQMQNLRQSLLIRALKFIVALKRLKREDDMLLGLKNF